MPDHIPGLLMIPDLFPTTVQTELLSRLFHRDLSNPEYQTNVHLHYDVTYPEDEEKHAPKSFFGDDPTRTFQPKDPRLHEPLDVQSFLEKRLRWITLGGEHDRTASMVSGESPPVIPQDIAKLLSAAFPETSSHAAYRGHPLDKRHSKHSAPRSDQGWRVGSDQCELWLRWAVLS